MPRVRPARAQPEAMLAGNTVRGRFIAIEGIDASGKSLVAGQLAQSLAAGGVSAMLVDRASAPDLAGGYAGEHLRALAALIWDYPVGARTSALGFDHWAHLLASWFFAVDHLVVRTATANGVCVIADSWHYKFVARFALSVGLPRAQGVFSGVSTPDRVLWLDVPPEVCAGRRTGFRTTEQGEWHGLDTANDGYLAYQLGVRSMYQALAVTEGWRVLTGVDRTAVRANVAAEVAGMMGHGDG